MENATRFDVEKLISYGDDLVDFLKDDRDINSLKCCLQQHRALQSRCDADFNYVQRSVQEYQDKQDMCRRKAAEAKIEVVADDDADSMENELEQELQRERLLMEELRMITGQIDDLEQQSLSIEERAKALKKLQQEDFRIEMKLSMYASVTSIIPDLNDQSKVSGHIVEKDKKTVERFEVDPVKQTSFETCNSIWKMINLL